MPNTPRPSITSVASNESPTARPVGTRAASLALLTAALWGGTPVAISYSVDTLPPVAVAGIRFAQAAIFMLLWCRWEGSPIGLSRGQFVPPAIAGTLLFVQISLFNLGVQWSNSSHGSIFINTFIFWVVAIEHFVTREDRLSLLKTCGLVVAAAGVAVILVIPNHQPSKAGDTPTLFGDVILLTSAFVLAIKIVYTKHSLKRLRPGQMVLWHDIVGVCWFTGYSILFEADQVAIIDFKLPVVLGLAYQGVIVAGLCFAIQARLLRRHSASSISVYAFTTPIFGIILAVLFRGDALSPWLFVAGASVAIGILLVNWNPNSNGNSSVGKTE